MSQNLNMLNTIQLIAILTNFATLLWNKKHPRSYFFGQILSLDFIIATSCLMIVNFQYEMILNSTILIISLASMLTMVSQREQYLKSKTKNQQK